MPFGKRHKEQRAKNFILLGILVAVIASVYALTLLKMGPIAQ